MRPLEEQLRALIDAGVDPVSANEAMRRPAHAAPVRAPRRRWTIAIATALVLSVAITGLIIATQDGDHERSVVATDSTQVTARPQKEVVAALDNGTVVVLDARDGAVIRTIFTSSARGNWTSGLSAAPDGSVYLGLPVPSLDPATCGSAVPPSIIHLDSSGNWSGEPVAGQRPLVSPDGRWLAYQGPRTTAPASACDPFDVLVLRDLASGTEYRYQQGASYGGAIAWRPDSAAVIALGASPTSALLDIGVAATGLGPTTELAPLTGNGLVFLPSGAAATASPTVSGTHIVVIDPGTGKTKRLVTETSVPLYLLAANRAGTSFLLEGPLADTPDGHTLYTLDRDATQPVALAEHVHAADWITPPDTRPSTAQPSGTDPSSGIVTYLLGDRNSLVVLDQTGQELRTIYTGPELASNGVSAPLTGTTLYATVVDDAHQDTSCAGTTVPVSWRIASFDVDGGPPVPIVRGQQPVVSDDGRQLAYVAGGMCDQRVRVLDLHSGETQPVGLGEDWRGAVPLAWSPDGKRLAVAASSSDSQTQRVFIVTVDHQSIHPTEVDIDGLIQHAAYLPDGRLVVEVVNTAPGSDLHPEFWTITKNGQPDTLLFRGSRPASGVITAGGFALDADATGRLAYTTDAPWAVNTWTPGSEPRTLLEPNGLGGATWLPTRPKATPNPRVDPRAKKSNRATVSPQWVVANGENAQSSSSPERTSTARCPWLTNSDLESVWSALAPQRPFPETSLISGNWEPTTPGTAGRGICLAGGFPRGSLLSITVTVDSRAVAETELRDANNAGRLYPDVLTSISKGSDVPAVAQETEITANTTVTLKLQWTTSNLVIGKARVRNAMRVAADRMAANSEPSG